MNDTIHINHRQYDELKSLSTLCKTYRRAFERLFLQTSFFIIDSQAKEDTVSEGCCRAVIIMNFLQFLCYLSIFIRGIIFPKGDFPTKSMKNK